MEHPIGLPRWIIVIAVAGKIICYSGRFIRYQVLRLHKEMEALSRVLPFLFICRILHHVTIQEGHNLCAGAGDVGIEVRCIGVGGDAFLDSPQNCVIEVDTRLDIHEVNSAWCYLP